MYCFMNFVNFCCLSQSDVSTDNRKVSTFFAFQHVRCRCCYRSQLDRFLKEGRKTLPRSFSRLTVVQLLGGCISERNTKKPPGGELYFCLGSPIAMEKKPKSHNGTMALILKKKKINNKTKNSRQFSSHALRYASLIMCLLNSFLIGQMSNRDRSVRQTTKRGHVC